MFSSILWSKKKKTYEGFEEKGLRILIKLDENRNSSKILIKPISNILIKPTFSLNQIMNSMIFHPIDDHNYCFLKSCYLCHKPLNLDKEVYMYRGDLGFCSVECRERQMYINEMKEIEIRTKKTLESLRRRRRESGFRCETGKLLEEFPERRRSFSTQNKRAIFS